MDDICIILDNRLWGQIKYVKTNSGRHIFVIGRIVDNIFDFMVVKCITFKEFEYKSIKIVKIDDFDEILTEKVVQP